MERFATVELPLLSRQLTSNRYACWKPFPIPFAASFDLPLCVTSSSIVTSENGTLRSNHIFPMTMSLGEYVMRFAIAPGKHANQSTNNTRGTPNQTRPNKPNFTHTNRDLVFLPGGRNQGATTKRRPFPISILLLSHTLRVQFSLCWIVVSKTRFRA